MDPRPSFDCHVNATCTNRDAAHTCACDEGFVVDEDNNGQGGAHEKTTFEMECEATGDLESLE